MLWREEKVGVSYSIGIIHRFRKVTLYLRTAEELSFIIVADDAAELLKWLQLGLNSLRLLFILFSGIRIHSINHFDLNLVLPGFTQNVIVIATVRK